MLEIYFSEKSEKQKLHMIRQIFAKVDQVDQWLWTFTNLFEIRTACDGNDGLLTTSILTAFLNYISF